MNKKILLFIGIVFACIISIHVYASILRSDLRAIATEQSADQSEVFYRSLVLENYDTLTYLILTGGVIIWVSFAVLITLKRKFYGWVLGFILGIAYVFLELNFYKSFF